MGTGLLVCTGCGSQASPEDNRAQGVFRLVGMEYGRYMARHRDSRPADLEQFRAFLQSRSERLASLGVNELDVLLTSPRDGEPLVILTGPERGPISPYGNPWAAYERTGFNGLRLVTSSRGTVVEMTQEEFEVAFLAGATDSTTDADRAEGQVAEP